MRYQLIMKPKPDPGLPAPHIVREVPGIRDALCLGEQLRSVDYPSFDILDQDGFQLPRFWDHAEASQDEKDYLSLMDRRT